MSTPTLDYDPEEKAVAPQDDNRFAENGDDSSDEEDSEQRYKTYQGKLPDKHGEYLAHAKKTKSFLFKKGQEADFSFASFAIGIKLLFHPNMNQKYYPKKIQS